MARSKTVYKLLMLNAKMWFKFHTKLLVWQPVGPALHFGPKWYTSGIPLGYNSRLRNIGGSRVRNLIVERLRGLLLCGFTAAFLVPLTGNSPALAQAGAGGAQGAEIEEIVVTGSRLRRDDLSAPSPTVIVTADEVRLSGRGTLEGLLNELPQLNADGTASTANISQAGMHTADLRSLRPERTLVLVNGKRFAPANQSGLVDVSRIPDALIERIDVITGGASAVYGSDAIAGAINFIMDDDFEGLDVRYNNGASTKSDGQTNKLDVTFGTNYADDRGNLVLSFSRFDQQPVLFDDREYSRYNVDVRDGQLVRAGSGNIPGTRFSLTGSRRITGWRRSDGFYDDRDYSNGGAGTCGRVAGIRFGRNGVPLPWCDPEDRFNTNPTNFLLRPYERYSITGLADFRIHENVEAYTELYFMNNQNTWNLNAASFTPRTSGQVGLILPNYANNPVIPQATRDFISANCSGIRSGRRRQRANSQWRPPSQRSGLEVLQLRQYVVQCDRRSPRRPGFGWKKLAMGCVLPGPPGHGSAASYQQPVAASPVTGRGRNRRPGYGRSPLYQPVCRLCAGQCPGIGLRDTGNGGISYAG